MFQRYLQPTILAIFGMFSRPVLKLDKDWKNTTGVHTNQIFFCATYVYGNSLW